MVKKDSKKSKKDEQNGGGAAEYGTAVFGAAGQQHAASDTDHTINMQAGVSQCGGEDVKEYNPLEHDNRASLLGGKTRRGKKSGSRRRSRKLTPWNHFVKKQYKAGKAHDKTYSFKQALKDSAKLYKSHSKTEKK